MPLGVSKTHCGVLFLVDRSVTLLVEKDNWGPIDKSYGKKTSSKKQGDQNPVYGETFTWEIPDLKNMVLYVKVMDSK